MRTSILRLELAGLMLIAIALAPGSPSPAEAKGEDHCLSCHKDVESAPALKYENDVHFKAGISCAACHGGDPSQEDMDAAMNPTKGYAGVPKGDAIVKTCLGCHADSSAMGKFRSKIDTEPFKKFKESVHGRTDIATCITCHSVHEIRSPRDPESTVFPTREVLLCSRCHGDASYMKTFNPSLPTDQLEKYRTSTHGQRLEKGDSKVATCSDCHGAHDIFPHTDPRSHIYALNVPKTCGNCHGDPAYMKGYSIPTDQYTLYVSSVHGEALLKKQDISAPACNDCHGNHGAAPPGLQSVSHVCGGCHALNAEYFEKSPHAAGFKENGIAQCEACHGNHGVRHPDDDMLRVGSNSVCESCHTSGDPALETAKKIYDSIQTLKNEETEAEKLLGAAEEKGMDVSDARFKAKDIPGVLIKARTVLHTANLKDVKTEIQPGIDLAKEARAAGTAAIEEYSFRRKGLGISTLFITLLVVALYLKIRHIESRQQEGGKKQE